MAKEEFLEVTGKNRNIITKILVQSYLLFFLKTNSPYTVTFITPEGEKIDVKATEGDSMLDLAQRYDIDLECMYKKRAI
jgi:hypothetical protein